MKQHTFIIAEAGVNHNGSLEMALQLVDAAVDAGVDCVKFQTYKTENLVSQSAPKADYQINNTQNENTQFEMLKQLELSEEMHQKILDYCKEKNILFFSTAFDLSSLQYLKEIGLQMVKIPSGEITNYPYLKKAAQLFDRIIISTGMSTIDEIKSALQVFLDEGISKENITILHCNTEYPTPMEDVNLKAMLQIQKEFGTAVGYSDHTLGIEVPIAAVALGASLIEKHFTLDRTLPGPDHAASLEPKELKTMVSAIRNIEKSIAGDGIKKPSKSEIKNIPIGRKSIVAKTKILKGGIFTEENITCKRPGNGLSPMLWNKVIGQVAKKDFNEEEPIEI